MKYAVDKLPFADFRALGLSKEEVLNLPEMTLNSLLNGNRTGLMRFENVPIKGIKSSIPLDAKLSLRVNEEGRLKLFIHPVQKNLQNRYELTDREQDYLLKNEHAFVPKLVALKGGKLVETLVTYDPSTNEYVAIERDKIKAPQQIDKVPLTPNQQKDFVSGKPITINGKTVRISPNSETGLQGSNQFLDIKIGHSRYTKHHLLFDFVLFATGLGHLSLLYHLANFLANSKLNIQKPETQLQDKQFRDQLAEADKDFKEQKVDSNNREEVKEQLTGHLENKIGNSQKDEKYSPSYIPAPKRPDQPAAEPDRHEHRSMRF